MDSRPVGVFDSGVGGLTVLHECLVTMPHEDFVYLGDHARLPYGPRSRDEVRRFAHEIGVYLERQGVKMVVVACNTATSVALPDLQEQLGVSYLFISHDLGVIHHVSDRILVMHGGRVVEQGAADEVFRSPQHPYTQQLLGALPRIRESSIR